MKNLFKGNKILCILTFISIAIVLSYALTFNFLEKETTITTCYNILYNLALGVLINFIFFIFQLYIPNIRKQKKAFSIAKSSLEWLYFLLSDIVLSTNNFINIKSDNTIELKIKHIIFYDIILIQSMVGLLEWNLASKALNDILIKYLTL